ncbi:hypothetical protein ACJMK2_015842 [Sinanodonta woodiana]|uniref:Uncharacterized protein n=1 Tax=Sinanodonta woodiana TaxID=1069815 RepID=A0ABD3URQ4_SINWO
MAYLASLYSTPLLLFICLIVPSLCEQCAYYDGTANAGYTYCYNGCCGTYYNRYCCMNYWAIVGIVFSGLLALGVLASIVIACCSHKNNKQRSTHPFIVNHRSHNSAIAIIATGQYGIHACRGDNEMTTYPPTADMQPPPYGAKSYMPPSYEEISHVHPFVPGCARDIPRPPPNTQE